MSEIYTGDPSFKYPLMISSIPLPQNEYSFATGTLNATTQLTISWTSTPSRSPLSLWNFMFTVRFGVDDDDHAWPKGTSLTDNQGTVIVSMYTDAIGSHDPRNIRVNRLVMRNGSPDSFSYFMYFKAYTFAASVGSSED